MDELQQRVLLESMIWYGGLVGPLVAGAVAVVASHRPGVDRVRAGFIGAVGAFAIGAAGSYGAGETILGAMGNAGDLPWHIFLQAWHRMWYPVGIGLFVGVALALFTLLPKRPAA